MRKIVNGKLYDTDKATIIYVDYNNNRVWYVTKKGNYFVYYANTGQIQPKTEDEVKAYLCENDPEKYMELFGEVEEA